jgi:tetratricopeptide (TPR) repeat protein
MKRDTTAARAAFERAIAIDPNNVDAIAGLTSLDVAAKTFGPAKARIEERIAANPKNVRLHMLAARFYAGTGDMAASEAALRKALELDPSHFEVYGALGQLYAAQKRLDEARREFEKLAQARPEAAVGSYTLIGIIQQLQNKNSEARATYEKVISLDSRAAVAANNLAWIYAEEGGNLDIALQLAQTAKAQMPERPEVNDTLGWIYYKKGLANLAIGPLRESVETDPKNAGYHYHLGLAYLKNGDLVKARQSLQEALKLQPDFDGAADAKQALASLPK